MIRALLGKELRQHGFALLFLLLLPFAGLILISTHGVLHRASNGGFEAVRFLLITFVPLACLVIGQLFIAQEFRHKTQLFLEGLPLPRWRMLVMKFGLGLGLILLATFASLVYVGWKAHYAEAMTPRFAALLAAKSLCWTLFVYTLCFAYAFLGRYRLFFGLIILFGLAYSVSVFDLPVSEFGPFSLVDFRFAFERYIWPVKALAVTTGLILLFVGMAFSLGLVRDATVAAMLAEKMSAREKMVLTFTTIVLLLVAAQISENRKTATPVLMPGATESDRSVVRVIAAAAVDAPSRPELAALRSTVSAVAQEMDALTSYLGCRSYPPIFIVHRRDLGAQEFTNGELKTSQGVLVRANLTAPEFKIDALSNWLRHETLVAQSNGLVERERNAWVLDGFEWWWPRSKHGEISAWDDARKAVHENAKPLDFSTQEMHAWLTVRKDLGADQARMLAGSVLALIAERHGTASLRRFLADRLGEAQPIDSRGWLHDVLRPNSVRLRAATGLSEDALINEWHSAFSHEAMNRALLAKELRTLRPYAVCILAFFILGQIFMFATESPDLQRYDPVKWLDKSRSGMLVIAGVFSLLIGAGILMQEREQGTLLFLDGLPLSRSRVFGMKALAGLLVGALVPVLDVGSDILLDRFSRTSVDGPFPWNFAMTIGGLEILVVAYVLALAMLVSFTRAWFPLVTGLLLWTYLWMRQRGFHWLMWFDPYEMLGPSWVNSRVLIPWRHVAGHVALTVGALIISWLGFLSLGDRVQYAADRLGRLHWLAIIGTGIRWLAPIVWIAALVELGSLTAGTNLHESNSPVGEDAFSKRESQHYEFLFRTAQLNSVKPLIDAADGVYAGIVAYLEAPNTPTRIVVDLASEVMSHAAGQTTWTKIGMPVMSGESLEELKLILGHETTHVFIEQLADGRAAHHFNETRFLHEGLATHVHLTLFGSDKDRTKNRREVAGAWSRGKVPLELLADNAALAKKRDLNLVYPLGSVFAGALVETYGQDAPARLLRAIARKDAPSGLKGATFWRDTMQAAGMSLDRVAAAYDADCDSAVTQEKKFVDGLPRLTATVKIVGENIVVQPKYEGKSAGKMVCYTEADDPFAMQAEPLHARDDGTFTWPLARHSQGVFRYLLGWQTDRTRLPVFEPWAEAVPEAAAASKD